MEDQDLADYAYNMQVAGEEKMNKFAYKEAYDYMIVAAESYLKVSKTSKDSKLVVTVKEKLAPLLDRVLIHIIRIDREVQIPHEEPI